MKVVLSRPGGARLLPGPLDDVARRFAPAFASPDLRAQAAGTGHRRLHPLLWVLAAVVAGQSLLHVVDAVVFDLRVERASADEDSSLAGWLGTVTTFSAAYAALLLAVLARGALRPMLALGAGCAFLSLDDAIVLHELVARQAKRFEAFGHDGYTFWVALYLPLLCVLGWLLLRTARSVDPGAGRWVVVGLACLAGAVVLEATAPVLYALGSDRGQPLYESEVTVEEALETGGWGLIGLGLLAAALDLVAVRRPADQSTS